MFDRGPSATVIDYSKYPLYSGLGAQSSHLLASLYCSYAGKAA